MWNHYNNLDEHFDEHFDYDSHNLNVDVDYDSHDLDLDEHYDSHNLHVNEHNLHVDEHNLDDACVPTESQPLLQRHSVLQQNLRERPWRLTLPFVPICWRVLRRRRTVL